MASFSPFQAAFLAALVVLAVGVPHAMGARSLGVVEWPCCRQYDAPTAATVTAVEESAPVEVEFVPGGAEELFKRFPTSQLDAVEDRFNRFETAAAEEVQRTASVGDNAEPEWPCCRQYDAPPTV